MPTRLPTSSRMDPESRPTRAALRKRPSGRSRLQQDDPSTISSPAQAAADPDKAGRPRSDRNPHNHSPPTLTTTRVQISDRNPHNHSPPTLTSTRVQIRDPAGAELDCHACLTAAATPG